MAYVPSSMIWPCGDAAHYKPLPLASTVRCAYCKTPQADMGACAGCGATEREGSKP